MNSQSMVGDPLHRDPLHRIETHEQVCEQRYTAIERRLGNIERLLWGIGGLMGSAVFLAVVDILKRASG